MKKYTIGYYYVDWNVRDSTGRLLQMESVLSNTFRRFYQNPQNDSFKIKKALR